MNAILRYITGQLIEEVPSVDLTSDKSGEGSTSVCSSSPPSMGQCIPNDSCDDNGVDEDNSAGCSGSSVTDEGNIAKYEYYVDVLLIRLLEKTALSSYIPLNMTS
jgi:hypothetical protein